MPYFFAQSKLRNSYSINLKIRYNQFMNNEFIHNPQGFSGHSHASSIEEHNGQIYLSWYAYEEKEHTHGQIVISKFSKEIGDWTKGKFIFPDYDKASCGNPVIFSFAGKLHIFFVVLRGGYWDKAQIYTSTMNDDESWTNPERVNTEAGIMVRHRPIINQDQATICAYDEKTMSTILYKFSSNLKSWTKFSEFSGEYIQGDILQFSPKEWQMYLRAAGDNTHVMKALSANGGATWEIARDTPLLCPLSGIAAIKLSNDQILVCNNHTEQHKRNPLSLSLSSSKGVSFELGPYHIDKSPIELSYPSLLQDSDGNIHISYTYNRKMIKHILISVEELTERCKAENA